MVYLMRYETPVGIATVLEENGAITALHLGERPLPAGLVEKRTPLLRETCNQLAAYFAGQLRVFDLPLAPRGTAFERTVWDALCTIPYGETRTYGQLAAQVGSPKACRAVGRANGRNPIWIVQPCHRVIGADGRLTGYAGGLDVKAFLLQLEGAR